jgi:predicted O-methyltransferase YrrM
MEQVEISRGESPGLPWQSAVDADLLRSKIIFWAKQIREWGIAWRTGIYPAEMAAFLGLCDYSKIRSIIESGRGDGYSTEIIGEYGDRTDTDVVSIDLEADANQARACRKRLERYRNLTCLVGDAFAVLPRAAANLRGPIALLLDGPKLQPANRLSLVASYMFDVGVVAHHNCPLEASWGQEFSNLFPGAFHYEQLNLSVHGEWQEFKKWERDWVGGYEQYDEVHMIRGRSLELSSLAMAVISQMKPSLSLFRGLVTRPLRYNPFWLWTKWSIRRRVCGGL